MSENKTPAVDVKDFVLNRLRHESDKWYEARKQVFLEHVDELGIEQAETLSMVWSNMRFLKCRYAAEIEAKVKDWGGKFFSWTLQHVEDPCSLLVITPASVTLLYRRENEYALLSNPFSVSPPVFPLPLLTFFLPRIQPNIRN